MPSRVKSQGSADASPSFDDPLTVAIRPSPAETLQERKARIQREIEAKEISDTIDQELERQAIAERKEPRAVKILLLGKKRSSTIRWAFFSSFFSHAQF